MGYPRKWQLRGTRCSARHLVYLQELAELENVGSENCVRWGGVSLFICGGASRSQKVDEYLKPFSCADGPIEIMFFISNPPSCRVRANAARDCAGGSTSTLRASKTRLGHGVALQAEKVRYSI